MKKNITVIMGGHGGMGKAIAKELGKEMSLVLADRSKEKLLAVKASLEELGYEVYTYELDIQNEANVKGLAEYAASLGDVKRVIQTAGVSPTDTDAETVIKVNALGTLYATNAFYEVMAEDSVMINFASVAAYTMEMSDEWKDVFEQWDSPEFYAKMREQVEPFSFDEFFMAGTAYALSKRFVIYYTQKNVMRFAAKGCRLLSVSPGSYLTPMHQKLLDNQPETAEDQLELIPCKRWGHPYEIAALITFLCSRGAAYIAGVDILADAGQIANTFVEQIQ
ncbi:MAG TPA: SDR family oxidoreductase [Anaerovoracaceae bacterium]|nr:SDR family oxidoreductase [Anaerovoracaceae bacterium]